MREWYHGMVCFSRPLVYSVHWLLVIARCCIANSKSSIVVPWFTQTNITGDALYPQMRIRSGTVLAFTVDHNLCMAASWLVFSCWHR